MKFPGRYARLRKLFARARGQPPAVSPRALARFADPHFAAFFARARRSEQIAKERARGTYQRHRNGPAIAAMDERAGAVDRVDQPDQIAVQPVRRIGCLLRQPASGRQQRLQFTFEEFVDRQIDRGYRIVRRLVPVIERVPVAWPASEGDASCFADNGFEILTIDQTTSFSDRPGNGLSGSAQTALFKRPPICLCGGAQYGASHSLAKASPCFGGK